MFQSINFAMIDVKHMDSNAHRRLTGVGNETILQNIRYIVRHFDIPVTIRIPVVPGCNDSKENICRTAQFIREELDGSIPLQLLPYHRLGETKSSGLGRKTFFTTQPSSQEQMELLKQAAEAYGIHTQIGG